MTTCGRCKGSGIDPFDGKPCARCTSTCPHCGTSSRIHPVDAETGGRFEWRPIETAPKDRTWILCAWKNSADRYGIPIALYWHGECWTNIDPALMPVVQNTLKPTEWMPLPPSPDGSMPQVTLPDDYAPYDWEGQPEL